MQHSARSSARLRSFAAWGAVSAVLALGIAPATARSAPLPEQVRQQVDRLLERPEFSRVRAHRASREAGDAPRGLPSSGDGSAGRGRNLPRGEGNGEAGRDAQDDGREAENPPDLNPDQPDWPDAGADARDADSSPGLDLPARAAGAIGQALMVLAWIVIAGLLAAIFVVVVRTLMNRKAAAAPVAADVTTAPADEVETPAEPLSVLPAEECLRQARELAARGEFKEAIVRLVLGTMGQVEREGLIQHRQGLTHRDYLRACRSRPSLRNSFQGLVAVFEPVCFGRRPATQEMFDRSVQRYQLVLTDRGETTA